MEKIIEIDLTNENDIYEKYNKKMICKELVDYIVDCSFYTNKNDNLKLVINNYLSESYIEFIKISLLNEYNKGIISHLRNNARQIIYLIIGMLLLFISTLIEKTILKEIILIGGWVLIWEMMELVMFSYTNGRRRRYILKKIIDGDIIENFK